MVGNTSLSAALSTTLIFFPWPVHRKENSDSAANWLKNYILYKCSSFVSLDGWGHTYIEAQTVKQFDFTAWGSM